MQKSDTNELAWRGLRAEVLDCALEVTAELRREALFEMQAAVVSAKERMSTLWLDGGAGGRTRGGEMYVSSSGI
jgi:hypothetical protein